MTEFDHYVMQEFDQQVYNAGEDGIKRQEAIAKVVAVVGQAIEDGACELPDVERLVRLTVVAGEKQRQDGRRNNNELQRLVDVINGDTLDFDWDNDPLMTRSWALGDGERIAGKYMTVELFDVVDSLERRNATSTVAAYETNAQMRDQIKWAMRRARVEFVSELRNAS